MTYNQKGPIILRTVHLSSSAAAQNTSHQAAQGKGFDSEGPTKKALGLSVSPPRGLQDLGLRGLGL